MNKLKRSEPKWVIEFDKRFNCPLIADMAMGGEEVVNQEIKSFIHTLLAHSQEQARGKAIQIVERKIEYVENTMAGGNLQDNSLVHLDALLKELKGTK